MNSSRNAFNRPLVRLAAFAFISLFIAAPTPGNVGGCSGTSAGNVIADPDGAGPGTAEFEFFDRGLCGHFCQRLSQCGVLCQSLANPPPGCSDDSGEAFYECMRGSLKPSLFGGATAYPHSCPNTILPNP